MVGKSGSHSLSIGGNIDDYIEDIGVFKFGVDVGGEKKLGNFAVVERII